MGKVVCDGSTNVLFISCGKMTDEARKIYAEKMLRLLLQRSYKYCPTLKYHRKLHTHFGSKMFSQMIIESQHLIRLNCYLLVCII